MATRREFLGGAAAGLLAPWLWASAPAESDIPPNPLVDENALPGHAGWFKPVVTGAQARYVEGYTDSISYEAGQQIALKVSTYPIATYRVEVVRLGWYGGAGARLMWASEQSTGAKRDTGGVDTYGARRCSWPTAHEIATTGWPSGYYLVLLILTNGSAAGKCAHVPFVIRGRGAPIVVQAAVNTWQAYNSWGGNSLYVGSARKVSFERPFYWAYNCTPLSMEYQLVRFLEREGFHADYVTDVDVHRMPTLLGGRRLAISNGHDEYWSVPMRDAWEQARDAGTNLAFMGGNICYWHARLEDTERTVACFKEAAYSGADRGSPLTKRWRHIGRPEQSLLGVSFSGQLSGGESSYMDYRAVDVDHPWFGGAGLSVGDLLRKRVGYEWDGIDAAYPGAGRPLFANAQVAGDPAHVTVAHAPSGARVFAAGSLAFAHALDDWRWDGRTVEPADVRVQRFIRSMLSDLGGSPAATPSSTTSTALTTTTLGATTSTTLPSTSTTSVCS